MSADIPNGPVEGTPSASSSVSDDIVGLARLFLHARQNNIAYLVGTLVAYQIGLLDFIFEYGVGMCG